jgi:hypothetical protein
MGWRVEACSVPPVDHWPTEIFRSSRPSAARPMSLSRTRPNSRSRKARGSAPFSRTSPSMPRFCDINRLVWLRGQSRANPSPKSKIPLIHGKIQGISRFCRLSSSIREADMPRIPRVSWGNSLSRRTGNFRAVAGKICGRSGKFIRRSGKSRLRVNSGPGPGCFPRPSMAGLIG